MNRRRARSSGSRVAIGVLIIFGILFLARRQATTPDADEDAIAGGLDDALTSPGTVPERDGLAAAILIDVSGSMNETVAGQRKIVSARAAAITLVEQFARYADDHKGEPVQLGIFEFSDRDNAPDCRVVVPMGPPDRAKAAAAIEAMTADGGTPIGTAMVTGKLALDATGLSRRHLLVVTDGENTTGPRPDEVTVAIAKRPATEQPSVYFVAFDISARQFNGVRDAGGLVLEAANAKALNDTLDTLLRGKILIER